MTEERICKCGHKEEYHHDEMAGKIYRCNAITKISNGHVIKKCKCKVFIKEENK